MGTFWRTCATAPRRGPVPKLLWADLYFSWLLGRLSGNVSDPVKDSGTRKFSSVLPLLAGCSVDVIQLQGEGADS